MAASRAPSSRRARARFRERPTSCTPGLRGPVYCDSSALLKLYWPEPESPAFNRTVEERDDLIVSDLAVTEVMSALARRRREGTLAQDVVRRVHRAVIGGLDDGSYGRVELTRDTHRRAEHYLVTLSPARLRASDALHLALAMTAHAQSMAAFDVRLATAARAVGLVTYPA